MSKASTNNLLRVLILSQLQVFAIDDIQNDVEFWQQSVKKQSKMLVDEIIKKNSLHIKKMFEVKDGEFIQDLLSVVEDMCKALSIMDISQWGAMKECAEMITKNPHMVLSEEEKDKVISEMLDLYGGHTSRVKEAEAMIESLEHKLKGMKALGNAPQQVISADLINIKRKLKVEQPKYLKEV